MKGIRIKPSHKGMLHEALHIASSKTIPGSKLKAVKARAKKSGNVKLEREAVFAENARKWKH